MKKKFDPLGLNWVTCTTCKDNLEKKNKLESSILN